MSLSSSFSFPSIFLVLFVLLVLMSPTLKSQSQSQSQSQSLSRKQLWFQTYHPSPSKGNSGNNDNAQGQDWLAILPNQQCARAIVKKSVKLRSTSVLSFINGGILSDY